MDADAARSPEAGTTPEEGRGGGLLRHPVVPWIVGLVLLLPLPLFVGNAYHQYVLNIICINIILAVGLNIVKGFAGQVTVGHVAVAAIGAYTSAVVAVKFGMPFWLALPSAMLMTAIVGALIGIPAFRLEGAYLALATLGLAESVRIIIAGTEYLGGAIGFEGIPSPAIGGLVLDTHREYFYVVMPMAVIGIYFSFSILRSDIGRSFKAIREDQLAAAASGVDVRKYKLIAFVLSALYAGCAGSLKAHMSPGFLNPNDYTVTEMVTLLLMVVFGGIGHIWGGVIGAIVVTIINDLTQDYYQYRMAIFGSIIVLVVMFMPRGIGGIIDDFFIRRRFAAIRKARADAARGSS
jgi:branched-chain amino acid transport system permease protein